MRSLCHKLLLAALLTLGFSGMALADETIIYTDPVLAPEITLNAGWRSVDPSSHAGDAAEYLDLTSYPSASGDIMLFPFPHRIHFEFALDGPHDYFGDLSYAYRDIVLVRWIKRSLYHNLDTIELIDLDPTPSADPDARTFGVDVRDADEDYGVSFALDTVSLRIKPLDYPWHLFVDGTFVHKEGEIQQRFRSGSSNFDRASEARKIDWDTNIINYGSNMHLDFFEVQFSHEDKQFQSGDHSVMTEHYEASSSRAEGDYPHNLIADLVGHTDTMKVHTSYTGRFTASASISRGVRYNEDGGSEEDTVQGGVTIFARPMDRLIFTMKYQHAEAEVSNPDSLKSGYLGYSSYDTELTGIKDSMSIYTDDVSTVAKVNAGKWATLSAEYDMKRTYRNEADQWDMPSMSLRHTGMISAWGVLPGHLKWKAGAEHALIDNPAYNTDSDSASTAKASLTWSPVTWLSAHVDYSTMRGVRDELDFGDELDVSADDRLLKRQQLTCSLSLPISARVSLSGGYAMMVDRVRQDMVYGELVDHDVSYTDQSHSYFTNITYIPVEKISLSAGVNHTVAIAHYLPEEELVTSYSEVSSTQTSYTAGVDYRFYGGWSTALGLEYIDYNDLVDDSDNPTVSDGSVFIVSLKLARKW